MSIDNVRSSPCFLDVIDVQGIVHIAAYILVHEAHCWFDGYS